MDDMTWILIIIFVIALDQFTKYLVINNIEIGASITMIEKFFYLVHWRNKGAAWGIMQDRTIILIVMTILISIFLVFYMYKNNNKVLRISLSMILGGAIGNLIDRVLRPEGVVDFLNFYIFSYNFPAFNVADTFITVGTIILGIYILFIYKEVEA
ncbi:signal peptidase II [Herbivorax alkaliphila]